MPISEDQLKPSLHPVYARLLCAELRHQGWSEAGILNGTRLNWASLHEASHLFLSFEQTRRLIVRALALSDCPWLGLMVGQRTQLSAHGTVGYAAMASQNVGQVLMLIERFTRLRQRLAFFEVDHQAGFCLTLRMAFDAPDVHEYLVGHFAAGLVTLMETITGQYLRPQLQVHWPFAEPAWADHYRQYIPDAVFGATELRLQLPVELLLCPSLAPDPDAYRVALRDCERQLSALHNGGLSERIKQHLLSCQGHYPTLLEMSEREHVSTRTLIRHLRKEGQTYQQLLDGVREELACWLLIHTPMSVEAIAERLGYQDTSNFSRTFRRWVGIAPQRFRSDTSQ